MMPMTEESFTYKLNWAVVDKYKLHEEMKPWISNNVKTSTAEHRIVSFILDSMKNHDSASSVLEFLQSFNLANEVESEKLFLKMWTILILTIQNVEEEINWVFFDKHELHEKIRPWIRNEITELLKKQKESSVDHVVNIIREHTCLSEMLELLEPLLEEYTEMVVLLLWRTLVALMKILETDSVWNGEESCSRAGGLHKRNRYYSRPSFWHPLKTYEFQMLCELKRTGDAIPVKIEDLSSYEVDWAVSDREELHNKLRTWISSEIMEFVRPQKDAAVIVDSIVSRIKDHGSASDILKLVQPSLGDSSDFFVHDLWTKLISQIMLAVKGRHSLPYAATGEERFSKEKVIDVQYGDRFSRNRHCLLLKFDYENLCKLGLIDETLPKTKAELFSYEIDWGGVYMRRDKYMRRGIWIETLELIRQQKEAGPVDDQIMWSIFDYHVSASRREFTAQGEAIPVMLGIVKPIPGCGAEKFVMRMWYALICGIKLAEADIKKKGVSLLP
ncbi:hypothetical protein MKX01_007508 [Papaver californicum]|nr:hypothetical protein MKX01_007508 [Papaver californicum]